MRTSPLAARRRRPRDLLPRLCGRQPPVVAGRSVARTRGKGVYRSGRAAGQACSVHMSTGELIRDAARRAQAHAYLAVAEETVKAAHDAVRTYLVETFRARKGATLRGLVTVSWVQDGASRALRPALEVDPAFLRQHGLTQLNPQSRGAVGREKRQVEENPTAKIALKFARGLSRDDIATILKFLAAAFGAAAARGAAELDLGIGKLVARSRALDMHFGPEFARGGGAPVRAPDQAHAGARGVGAESPAPRGPGAGDMRRGEAGPGASATARNGEDASHKRVARTAMVMGGAVQNGRRAQAAGAVAVGARAVAAPAELHLQGRAARAARSGLRSDDWAAELAEARPRDAEVAEAPLPAKGAMDSVGKLMERLGDPFADDRPARRVAPEPDGRVTSLPGLADDNNQGEVYAFYRRGMGADLLQKRGKKQFGISTHSGDQAAKGMRMDQGEATVLYYQGKKPLMVANRSFQRKVNGFGQGNIVLDDAARRIQEERDAVLREEKAKEEEMERRRLMLNADAQDLVAKKKDQERRVLQELKGLAEARTNQTRRERQADVQRAREARFGPSVPMLRDEMEEEQARQDRVRQYRQELEEEIRRKHQESKESRKQRIEADRAALNDAQGALVVGVIRSRQEERERQELEEATLSTQALQRKTGAAGGS